MNSQITNAVVVSGGKVTTTSLKVAKVFGKRHDHVIRDIESLQVPDSFGKPNFGETEYEWTNNLGKKVKSKMYEITRDGFTILAMGFTGAKAMEFKIAYIEAFNAMEAKLRSINTALPIADGVKDPVMPDQSDKADGEIFERRVFYGNYAVIPAKYLAEILGIAKHMIHYLRRKHAAQFIEGVDVFSCTSGADYRKSFQWDMNGYPISAPQVTLFTESGARKMAEIAAPYRKNPQEPKKIEMPPRDTTQGYYNIHMDCRQLGANFQDTALFKLLADEYRNGRNVRRELAEAAYLFHGLRRAHLDLKETKITMRKIVENIADGYDFAVKCDFQNGEYIGSLLSHH